MLDSNWSLWSSLWFFPLWKYKHTKLYYTISDYPFCLTYEITLYDPLMARIRVLIRTLWLVPTLPPLTHVTAWFLRLPRSLPRLIVILLLQSALGQVLCFCGIVCSTWVAINAGTSKRTVLTPTGDETSVATRKGNIMCARTWEWVQIVVIQLCNLLGSNQLRPFSTGVNHA